MNTIVVNLYLECNVISSVFYSELPYTVHFEVHTAVSQRWLLPFCTYTEKYSLSFKTNRNYTCKVLHSISHVL